MCIVCDFNWIIMYLKVSIAAVSDFDEPTSVCVYTTEVKSRNIPRGSISLSSTTFCALAQ